MAKGGREGPSGGGLLSAEDTRQHAVQQAQSALTAVTPYALAPGTSRTRGAGRQARKETPESPLPPAGSAKPQTLRKSEKRRLRGIANTLTNLAGV